ncbi:FG-GAP-like repeat-containing protein [Haloarcula sp. S1AR25-5A]|uniref:FG-GAP-like repeat-containing protein n=1 Tax=Haloarcula terrestris TaxID=2950533 RepID=A0AAE4EZA7_9EURY|nr:FG-GAP-like repeat-containing protein [Haloarcula terrestris]MDS0222986.1 FG-GAP-like repeat-containing protein [Haloarcula terrestris]
MNLQHERIEASPPASTMSFCLTADLTGNGRPDVIVGALGDKHEVQFPLVDKSVDLLSVFGMGPVARRLQTNVFWYENPGWERHDVAKAPKLSVGGSLGDITGNGRPDLVAGQNIHQHKLWWFEIPDDPREQWTRRLITDEFEKYHDTAVADVDGDGENEVVGLSQESKTVFYYDIPEDPTREPWPAANRHIVAEDLDVEGVAIEDVDGDGEVEIIAGPNIFHRTADGWDRESIAPDWKCTRIAIEDFDGDGDLEIALVEGDEPYLDDRPARLGVFDPPDWDLTLLHDDLSNPHSLDVADFDGDGNPDIFVAEMGLEAGHEPRQFVFHNDGAGNFEETQLDTGIATHEAKVVDLDGDGIPDIVGKAYTEPRVDVWQSRP